ncbi:UNKNOWN [Stylonychia lemnae]|uniref:Peptidase C14 caspase domain-containing protein n=1 Tax=Stylonychia lemnae TaxID=5949 RepID=A0A078A5E2_STYLE|nr:UNKNOWN [Stylonychia lemnae]|eukprot:CDW76805.1 UNKNOWN [Stylonychia lemnae]
MESRNRDSSLQGKYKKMGQHFVSRRLLSIGINNYTQFATTFKTDLKTSQSDAMRITNLFLKDIKYRKVEPIIDKNLKNPWQKVQEKIEEIESHAKGQQYNESYQRALYVIYYAGHGVTSLYKETFGAIPYFEEKTNTETGEKIEQKEVKYFNFTDFATKMSGYNNTVTVIILDCCREYKKELNDVLIKGENYPNSMAGVSYLIHAVPERQKAAADETGGLFTTQLLNLIKQYGEIGIHSQIVFEQINNNVQTISSQSNEKIGYYNIFGPRKENILDDLSYKDYDDDNQSIFDGSSSSRLSNLSLNDSRTSFDTINRNDTWDSFSQSSMTDRSQIQDQQSTGQVVLTRKFQRKKKAVVVHGPINLEISPQPLELIQNFNKYYTCYMEIFDDKPCISDQYNMRYVKIQDVYKIQDSLKYICKPCYLRYLENIKISVIIGELSMISNFQENFITSKLIKSKASEPSLFLLKNKSFLLDERDDGGELRTTYIIEKFLPKYSEEVFQQLLQKSHSLQFIWLTERIFLVFTNLTELNILKLGAREYLDQYYKEDHLKERNRLLIVQVPTLIKYSQVISDFYLKQSTDYPALARYDRQIFIAGGHNNLMWMQYLISYDLASEQQNLLHQFEDILQTPTLLCNKLQGVDGNQSGLQFFYLGQDQKFTKMNYYFMPDSNSENKNKDQSQNEVQVICLNTESINKQLQELNFTYSYPAMFIFQGCYLVLFGGIDIDSLETTNRLLVIDIEDFANPKITEIDQENSDKEGQNYKDYFFGNQILSDQFQTFSLRGDHGIYKVSFKKLPREDITISIVKVITF